MGAIHLMLQGKGGVGKSLASSMLAQHQIEFGKSIQCVDTDPVNRTMAGYSALNVQELELMKENSKSINERQFDLLLESVIESDSDFVVDNGAASFVPFTNYIIENQAFDVLIDCQKQVYVHTVITGGQAMMDTLTGFKSLAEQLPEGAKIIVWLNEYFGEIKSGDKEFEQMKVFKENKDRIAGIIRIPAVNADTFGEDIRLMQCARLTFDEAIASAEFKVMSKQRLKMFKRTIWQQLDALEKHLQVKSEEVA